MWLVLDLRTGKKGAAWNPYGFLKKINCLHSLNYSVPQNNLWL